MSDDANLWPPPLRLNNDNTWHTWEQGDILYWRSLDNNDVNLEGFHVVLNAIPMAVSGGTTRLKKADGSGFLFDQYWIFNTVMLGTYQDLQTVDNITPELVNDAVKTDNWTKTPNIINEVNSDFEKHIELIDIPDDAPPFVVYTDTAIEMTDEQIKTFKKEYVSAVEKRDADRQNQSYDDDEMNNPNPNSDVNAPIFNVNNNANNVDLVESVYADDNVKQKVEELLKKYNSLTDEREPELEVHL